MGRIEPGDTVAVIGLGPVGLMALAGAFVMGASEVFAVDLVPERRARAADMGAVPIEGDALEEIRRRTGGQGVDVAVEAVGVDETIALALRLVRRTGRVSVVGVSHAREFPFDMTVAQLKALEFTIGLCSVQRELEALLPLTASGRLHPESVVTAPVPALAGRRRLRPVRLPNRRRRQGRPRLFTLTEAIRSDGGRRRIARRLGRAMSTRGDRHRRDLRNGTVEIDAGDVEAAGVRVADLAAHPRVVGEPCACRPVR